VRTGNRIFVNLLILVGVVIPFFALAVYLKARQIHPGTAASEILTSYVFLFFPFIVVGALQQTTLAFATRRLPRRWWRAASILLALAAPLVFVPVLPGAVDLFYRSIYGLGIAALILYGLLCRLPPKAGKRESESELPKPTSGVPT
jgi:hypothetical protein